ncbi:MAG: DctP family TRAP transporter solute-binding subunit [Acidobacteria bacterium]|nr:DctP family TRAP transporter solute-binding subunit [Acidobacteriota bacterium]
MRLVLQLACAASLVVSVACGGSGVAPGTPGGPPIVVRFTHVAADFTPKGQAARAFAELANERSDGRLDVRVFPSGQLFGDRDEIEALQGNNVQFIAPSIGKLISFDPRFQIGDLPFLFSDNAAESRFWDGEAGRALLQSLEPQDIVGLATWPNGMRQLMNRTRPIHTPADTRGLKMRIPSGGLLVDTLEAFGAGASVIPFTDVYTALQQGVVDGTIATFDNIEVEKYAEVLDYLTVANVNSLSYGVLVNKTFWDGLPADLRQILSDAMDEATVLARRLATELDETAMASLKATIDVVELTPEERQQFVDASEGVWTKYTPILGQDLLDAALRVNE